MNKRVDNIMHKNTYNTSVNKKLNLQEDIEKLEEQKVILERLTGEVSEENNQLQIKHKELLMKQAVGYDGWEDDLISYEDNMLGIVNSLEEQEQTVNSLEDIDKKTTHYSRYLNEELYREIYKLEELIKLHPKLVISSKDYLERSPIMKRLQNSLDNVIAPLSEKSKELTVQLKTTKKKEEEYTKYLSQERKTGKWYFLAGCLAATAFILLLK